MKRVTLLAALVAAAVPGSSQAAIIAGWDVWNSGTAPAASVLEVGVTGTAATTSTGANWNTTTVVSGVSGASSDGTWGTFAGPPVPETITTPTASRNITLLNGLNGTITFTITNGGTQDIELSAFHFDALAFRPNAARDYALSVLAGGGITAGSIFTSLVDAIPHNNGLTANLNSNHLDADHALTGLADHTLAVGESARFLLAFSGGAATSAHHLFLDNVAVSGEVVAIPEPAALTLLGVLFAACGGRRDG